MPCLHRLLLVALVLGLGCAPAPPAVAGPNWLVAYTDAAAARPPPLRLQNGRLLRPAPVAPGVGSLPAAALGGLSNAQRAALAQQPGVRGLEADQDLTLLAMPPSFAARDLRPSQAWPSPPPGAPYKLLWATLPKVHIAVLDTGVDASHPDLLGAALEAINLLPADQAASAVEANDSVGMDYHGHGTAMAGIVVAQHNGLGIDGLNPLAHVSAVKIFNAAGQGRLSDLLRGLAWARAHKVDIVQLSCGSHAPSALLHQAVQQTRAAGILLVAAAGNDGAGMVQVPASYPEVIAVGSSSRHGERLSQFSNHDQGIAYYAPGEDVLSLTSTYISPNPYAPISGTSAAAAIVTGLLSLVHRGDGEAAAAALARQSFVQRGGEGPPFCRLNVERMVADASGRPLAALVVQRWHVERAADGDLTVELQGFGGGNRDTSATRVDLCLRDGERVVRLPLGDLPPLRPDATWCLARRVALPAAWSTAGGPSVLAATPVADNGSLPPISTDVGLRPVAGAALEVREIWLAAGDTAPRLHVRLHNAGSEASIPAGLEVALVPATHEGIFAAPQTRLTPPGWQAPRISPGDTIDVVMPLPARPPMDVASTLLATLQPQPGQDPTGAVGLRAWQSFAAAPAGQLQILYNQRAHVAQVEAAVELLRLRGHWIPDLHQDSVLLGRPEDVASWGGAIAVGLGNYRWDWGEQWKRYPPRAKTLLDGASAADGIDIVYHDTGTSTWDSHYWILREGEHAGLGSHSAWDKVQALILGEGDTPGALAAYRAGERAKAWWMLGHAAHLLGDLSTGAHTLNRNWHGVVGDAYHDWMGQDGHFRLWPASVVALFGPPVDPYRPELADTRARLRFLTYTTARVGASFPWHRLRSWLPSGPAFASDGSRDALGEPPHHQAYLDGVFAGFAAHPLRLRDLTHFEAINSRGHCSTLQTLGPGDRRADCWDGGDGHIDFNNLLTGDADGDLSSNADGAYTYAVRSIAGLLWLFARETGQV